MLLEASEPQLAAFVMKLRMISASPSKIKALVVGDNPPKRKPKGESPQKVAMRNKLADAD